MLFSMLNREWFLNQSSFSNGIFSQLPAFKNPLEKKTGSTMPAIIESLKENLKETTVTKFMGVVVKPVL